MKRFIPNLILMLAIAVVIVSCGKEEVKEPVKSQITPEHKSVQEKLKAYAKVEFSSENIDISHLTAQQMKLVKALTEAGKLVDKIFWKQSNHDATLVRDSLMALDTEEAKDFLHYVTINYGPYDVIYDQERFVAKGPKIRPKCGGYYPTDMTKVEFRTTIKENPELKKSFESLYTVIVRQNGKLIAIPYNEYYPEVKLLAAKLDEASNYANNPSLKKYLSMRAEALRTDDYLESDLQWMDLIDNDIDIVIGPIENYDDELFEMRAAYECVVMVKDPKASKELQSFKDNMNYFQANLPTEGEYKSLDLGSGNIIQVVNAIYFGGDCQKGTKTIAAALPNDPKVAEAKGRKLSMYINHMEAKFHKIVKPIAQVILSEEWANYVDVKAFTGFVTLHEVSHATGPKYTINSKEEVRVALREKFSAIEECKADILSMYNHKLLMNKGYYDAEYIKKVQATYVAGLYRSIRFGTGAHCISNFIQLNFLQTKGAIIVTDGKFSIDEEIFFDVVAELAKNILDIEANGNYEAAAELIRIYGQETPEIEKNISRLSDIPRDIDTYYNF